MHTKYTELQKKRYIVNIHNYFIVNMKPLYTLSEM